MNGLTWGIAAGVLMVIYSLVLYLFDQSLNTSISWIGYVLLVGVMIWGTLEYRKSLPGGFMSYGKAFSTSFMIVLFAAIIASIFSFLLFTVIAPELVQEIAEMSRQQAMERSPELSEEQIDEAMQMTAFFMSPTWMVVMGFISQLIIGSVISLITSIFLKKEDKSFV